MGLIRTLLMVGIISVIFVGCASSSSNKSNTECTVNSMCWKIKNGFNQVDMPNENEYKNNLKPYSFNYKPIIGSRHRDSRVVIDQGIILKAWINTYKAKSGSLVASHDAYIRVKEPDFVVNYETVPKQAKSRGLFNKNTNKVPFVFGSNEIDRSNIETNKAIKDYSNSVYEKDKQQNVEEQMSKSSKFDDEIKKFLKNKNIQE